MGTITELLGHWRHGDSEALSRLMVLLNDHLHEMACIQFARERANHTIQPTALINEVYLRLCDGVQINWTDRSHFFAVSASLMRRVLVDHARKRARSVDPGKRLSLTLAEEILPQVHQLDLIDLDRALERLNRIDELQHQVVELRLFVGLTTAEISELVGVTERTIQRKWVAARIWLHAQMQGVL